MPYWTAFLIGFLGSLHCVGMCGPIVLALPTASRNRGHFLLGRIFYNVGRIITYAALGAVFGALGLTLAPAGYQKAVSIAAGVVLVLAAALGTGWLSRSSAARLFYGWMGRIKTLWGKLFGQRTLVSLGLIGLLNGLLPCGLVYVALAGAAVTASPAGGALFMAAFGAGTFPLMLATALGGGLLSQAVRVRFQRVVPYALVLLGLVFILRGLSLGIPYLSPDLATMTCGGRCHGEAE